MKKQKAHRSLRTKSLKLYKCVCPPDGNYIVEVISIYLERYAGYSVRVKSDGCVSSHILICEEARR